MQLLRDVPRRWWVAGRTIPFGASTQRHDAKDDYPGGMALSLLAVAGGGISNINVA
jgi:hypothetical protein